jgi:L-asparagine transporter-like permease
VGGSQEKELHRGLEERHITLMSLGAAIGVGLFLGSATAIKLAGPGILFAYAFSGLIMFFIIRALAHFDFLRRCPFRYYGYLPMAGNWDARQPLCYGV